MIERNIHQIWIGKNKIPSHIKDWTNEIKEKHPNFTYYFWNDDNLPKLPTTFQKFYDSMPEPTTSSIKSDFLRIFLIFQYGGFYIDADFKIINGFNNSKINFDNLDGIISFDNGYGTSALGCSFFGFAKKHKLLQVLLNNVENNLHWLGPNYWSITFHKYFNYTKNPVERKILENDLKKYNVSFLDMSELETQCFQHIALASWVPGSEWNIKLKNNDYD